MELIDRMNSVAAFLSLRWLNFLLGTQAAILTGLLFWIYFFFLTLIFVLSTMAFHPLVNSNVVSVSIDFPSKWQWDVLFRHIDYDYSCADWDSLCDHLRDVPWEDV